MGAMLKPGRLDPAQLVDLLRRSFWFLPVAAMLVGGALGILVPMLDTATNSKLGLFTTSDRDSARGLLETIATVTVSVAGIAFSVTVVALQLASQQLGPTILRTFQNDRMSQATLGAFLGLFVYSLIALGRLATISLGDDASGPNLVLTFGMLAAVLAFGLFAAFIQHTISSLQAATLIRRITDDATDVVGRPYPEGFGESRTESAGVTPARQGGVVARARAGGFLNTIPADPLLAAAATRDGLVVQRVPIGDFVTGGLAIADVYANEDPEGLAAEVEEMVAIGAERTSVQDVAFPLRQLADVALRALSPSLNDPTTAENAMGALAHILGHFARSEPVSLERADADSVVRFIALAPDLDDLVRLGFEQVRLHGTDQAVFISRLEELLEELRRVANDAGRPTREIERQLDLIDAT